MIKASKLGRVLKIGGIVLGLAVLLFFLLVIIGPIPFQLAGLLLFGWFGFLSWVLPQTTLNLEIAFDALIALGLALFGLHRILCWWAKRGEGPSPAWRFGWTLKISLMILLLFATSIAAVGVVHQIAWLCREPKLIVMTGMGVQTREMINLKQVATALKLYADDHEGRLPGHVEELFPDYLPDHSLLFTRARDGDPPQPITYFAGYKTGENPETIIASSPRPFETSRSRTRAVAHLDTTARVILESEFQELMIQQRASTRR